MGNRITEHQEAWWGTQPCRECNYLGLQGRPLHMRPSCDACDGSGWCVWASLAREPWSEVLPLLYIGGHDFNVTTAAGLVTETATPGDLFDVVVSMYARRGFEPTGDTEYREFLFPDSGLTDEVKRLAGAASLLVATRVSEGRRVLSRCQAGLNRSSLVAGLAMIRLGFSGEDAVQLIRSKRSRWALCNREYEQFLSDGAAKKYLDSEDIRARSGGAGL